jgi:hypothetical protein
VKCSIWQYSSHCHIDVFLPFPSPIPALNCKMGVSNRALSLLNWAALLHWWKLTDLPWLSTRGVWHLQKPGARTAGNLQANFRSLIQQSVRLQWAILLRVCSAAWEILLYSVWRIHTSVHMHHSQWVSLITTYSLQTPKIIALSEIPNLKCVESMY